MKYVGSILLILFVGIPFIITSTGQATFDPGTNPSELYSFNTTCLNPNWEMIDPNFDSSFSLVQEPGSLTFILPFVGNDLYPNTNNDAPRLMQDWSGNFTIETKISSNPSSRYQGSGLLVWQDDDNFLRLEYGFGGLQSDSIQGVHFSKEEAGNYVPTSTNINNPISADPIHLRLSRNGDLFEAAYSADGVDWSDAGSVEFALTNNVKLGLIAINEGSSMFKAMFDSVQIDGNVTFSDDFNSTCLESEWAIVNPNMDSTFSLLANEGTMRIYVPFNGNDLYPISNYNAPRMLLTRQGDFTIITKVITTPGHDYQGAGILVWQDDDNFIRLEYGFEGLDGEPYPGIILGQEKSGTFSAVSPNSDNPLSSPEVYLRLHRFGDTFIASYSIDGNMWNHVGTTNANLNSSVQVGISAINQWQNNPFFADFDFVEFQEVNNLYMPIILH